MQLMSQIKTAHLPSFATKRVSVDYAISLTDPDYEDWTNTKTNLLQDLLAIFECPATKSSRIKLWSNLTTEAFLTARFISSRGKPIQITSTNSFPSCEKQYTQSHLQVLARQMANRFIVQCPHFKA